jgi:hypothetical protein
MKPTFPLRSLAGVAAFVLGVALLPPAASARSIGSVVRAFCLSAFETEMAQAGKTPPPGMAHYACGCVARQITDGGSLEQARTSCRAETARRYPI